MSSHWTCCTPRQHPLERSTLFSEKEWNELYADAEALFNTNHTIFDNSVRHRLVKKVLERAVEQDHADVQEQTERQEKRNVVSMPLACKKPYENSQYIEWSCTATILGDLADPSRKEDDGFCVKPQSQCDWLMIDHANGTVQGAVVTDLVKNEKYLITAKQYVVCAGAVLTAGIMAKSLHKSNLEVEEYCPALV